MRQTSMVHLSQELQPRTYPPQPGLSMRRHDGLLIWVAMLEAVRNTSRYLNLK